MAAMAVSDGSGTSSNAWSSKRRRIRALVMKETRQIVRDPSSIAIGVVLPLILILLFGYGLSLDVKNVPIAVVMEYPTPEAVELGGAASSSRPISCRRCCDPCRRRSSCCSSTVSMEFVRIPADFSRHLAAGDAQGAADRTRRRCQPGADHRGLCCRASSECGQPVWPAQGQRQPSPAGERAIAFVVQRGQ